MKCPRCSHDMVKTEIPNGWACMICGNGYREDMPANYKENSTQFITQRKHEVSVIRREPTFCPYCGFEHAVELCCERDYVYSNDILIKVDEHWYHRHINDDTMRFVNGFSEK